MEERMGERERERKITEKRKKEKKVNKQ